MAFSTKDRLGICSVAGESLPSPRDNWHCEVPRTSYLIAARRCTEPVSAWLKSRGEQNYSSRTEAPLTTGVLREIGTVSTVKSPRAQKAARELKKCKSATFHIDGCSYVIVANPEEQATRQDSTSREEGKGSPRLNGVIARRESYSVFRSRRRFGSSSSRSLSEDGACLGRKGEPARETPMDSPEAAEKASKRLRDILAHLEDDAIPKKDRRSAIEYAITVLDAVAAEGES
ncbi:Calcium/calmodulin-dependent 3',5'-cyclic nucleotide phosphodiesterase 1C, partial [Branchiostoma belcheri]